MATPAEIQEQLDPAGTGLVANIIQSINCTSAKADRYVVGLNDYAGRSRWVQTNIASSATAQATAILAALIA